MTKEDRAAARERIRNIKLLIAFLGLLLATPAPRLPDPANYQQAMKSLEAEHWSRAIEEENNSLKQKKTFEVIPAP